MSTVTVMSTTEPDASARDVQDEVSVGPFVIKNSYVRRARVFSTAMQFELVLAVSNDASDDSVNF